MAAAAVGLRLGFTQVGISGGGPGDAGFYHLLANAIADGHGYSVPLAGVSGAGALDDYSGATVPTAHHPPLFSALLAIPAALGLDSYGQLRAAGCAIGAITIPLVGLAGRRLGGAPLGLLAAALAVVYPPLVAYDSVLLSESLYAPLVAATILAALWCAERPSWRRGAVLGAAIGLAALTRSEALLLLVLLVPFVTRGTGRGAWAQPALAAVAAAALVVAPWCARNTIAFDRPVGITTGDGPVLAGANVHSTYFGTRIGGWDPGGLAIARPRGRRAHDDAEDSARLRRKGLDYARDHLGRVPAVALARVGRTWSVYPLGPRAKVSYNAFVGGYREWAQWAAMLGGWVAMALAAVGLLRLRRAGARLAPLVAPLALVTVTSAPFYGDPRFRVAADVSLVLLAAAGLAALRRRRAPGSPATRPG